MIFSVSKIDAAVSQLDWSIKLFLDHKAYVPSITLAGAAEEIIGETLGENSIHEFLITHFSQNNNLQKKIISQLHLNKAKNWLKHWHNLNDAETIDLELEDEAIQYIIRAMANLRHYDNSMPSEGPRFIKWLEINCKNLYTPHQSS